MSNYVDTKRTCFLFEISCQGLDVYVCTCDIKSDVVMNNIQCVCTYLSEMFKILSQVKWSVYIMLF